MCLLFIFDLLYVFVVYISDQQGWWFSRHDDYYNAGDPSDCCKRLSGITGCHSSDISGSGLYINVTLRLLI